MNRINIEPKIANDDAEITSAAAKVGSAFQQLGGGYFGEGYNKLVRMSLASVGVNKRLLMLAVYSMSAQTRMLIKRSIVPEAIGKRILDALDTIKKEIADGHLKLDATYSSAYEYIYSRLYEMLGDQADYAKVCYSQEDQNVGDLKLWIRDACDDLDGLVREFQEVLIHKAEENVKVIMPGNSQKIDVPVSLAHVMMAYTEMLGRDRSRIRDARARANTSPYGSMSLAGTAFFINREMVSRILGFDGSTANSIDAVTDRDFIMEFISAVSICATHLSRLAQDFLNWYAPGQGFISFPNDFVKQHPTLINKRDAEVIEMVRSKTGRIYGSLVNVLTVMKGLPAGNAHDTAEMLEPTFDAYDTLSNCLNVMSALTASFIVNRKQMKEAAQADYSTAPDLATWLIINLSMTVREAEQATRSIVDMAISRGKKLSLLELTELQSIDPRITDDIYSVLIPSRAVISRRSTGGTNPVQLRKAIRAARRRYL